MKYRKLYIAIAWLGLLSLCGCSDDEWSTGTEHPVDGCEITLTAEYPLFNSPAGLSRAVSVPEKTDFQAKDAIHVSAVFTVRGADNNTMTKTIYNCFVYDGNAWKSTAAETPTTAEEVMKWPWNAESGRFTAYYVPKSSGNLAVGDANTVSCRLNGTYSDCDVLFAETEELPFGHAVYFTFRHLCTRLVLTEVRNDYVDRFGLQTKVSPTGAAVAGEYKQMNTCVLKRNEDNTLNLTFIQEPNADGSVSVVSTASANQILEFYLQPGDYSKTEVCYANGRPYLELDIETLRDCQPGYSYEINVNHTPGVILKEDDDPWVGPEKDDLTFDIDIDAFLHSIEEGKSYSENDPNTGESVQITKFDELGHLELLYNLDFKNRPFTPRSLPNTCYLHGNYHHIKNVVNSLFDNLNGTIDNFELRNVNINILDANPPQSIGALTRSMHGTVQNMRLNGCSIIGYAPEDSRLTLSVGALVGEQVDGSIDNVTLMGNISVIARNTPNIAVCDATVDLGGIVGQSAGEIKNVTMQADADGNPCALSVKNEVVGYGEVSTGGIAGYSFARISDCIIACTVDASACQALQNCVGGLLGRITGGTMTNCTVSGPVTGGITKGDTDNGISGYSITGGISGYAVNSPIINDCYAFCAVTDTNGTHTSTEVIAVGGGFGMINSETLVVSDCRVIGSVAGAADVWKGSFIGICRGISDTDLQATGNQASDTNGNNFCGSVMK